jgi:rare lipoprotein A
MRLPVNYALPLAALVLLGGCGLGGDHPKGAGGPAADGVALNGPASDYPMVIGEPFTVGRVTYTPADTMNYDKVGYAVSGPSGTGISGANKVLPLPSYVEVTALDSGKTILVRLERRGPMSNDQLVELSPAAAAQLGIGGRAPVRVRRVNPPEPERALLRSGQSAPYRMDTPKSLLTVLMRKLDPQAPVAVATPAPVAVPTVAATPTPPVRTRPVAKPVAKPTPAPTPTPTARPTPTAKPTPVARPIPAAPRQSLVVQAGAFSSRERAKAVAAAVGGTVAPAGRLFRVRIGPFATQAEADAALAKARTAGYSEARIQRAD